VAAGSCCTFPACFIESKSPAFAISPIRRTRTRRSHIGVLLHAATFRSIESVQVKIRPVVKPDPALDSTQPRRRGADSPSTHFSHAATGPSPARCDKTVIAWRDLNAGYLAITLFPPVDILSLDVALAIDPARKSGPQRFVQLKSIRLSDAVVNREPSVGGIAKAVAIGSKFATLSLDSGAVYFLPSAAPGDTRKSSRHSARSCRSDSR